MIYAIQYNSNKIKIENPIKVKGTQVLLPVKPINASRHDTKDQFNIYNKQGLVIRLNQQSTFTYKV